MGVDIAKLLTDNAGSIVAGLSAIVGATVGGLMVRSTARSSSRTERTDEYRREVRSAASSVMSAVRVFIDAASALERSVFWVKDAIRTPSGHDERYLVYQLARVQLEEKIADFDFLVDIDMLSKAARAITFQTRLIDLAIPDITDASKLPNYTEANLSDDLAAIRKRIDILQKAVLPDFRESVIKHAPHTIVQERRRRILRLFQALWRRLVKQYHRTLSFGRPLQEPSAKVSMPPDDEGLTPTDGDHAAT